MILYGIGKNYKTLKSYGLLPAGEKLLLVDRNKQGEYCDGNIINGPEILKDYTSEDIFVLPTKYDSITESLVYDYGVNRERIRTISYINKRIVLGDIDHCKYVMLTTDSDYLNFPYISLLQRNDFKMCPILDQISDRDDYYSDKTNECEVVFIVRDHCFVKLTEYGIMDYLKRKYINASWVSVMSDMCEGEYGRFKLFGDDYLVKMKSAFDIIMTYHSEDARRHGLIYYEQAYPSFCYRDEVIYDVLFIGNSKNRLKLLHNTFLWLKEHEVTCRFYINGVNENEQIADADIVYNTIIPYNDYLREVAKCKCILEICQTGDETTYRYAEAIINNKKLLVNDMSCIHRKYYDSRFIRYFAEVTDIDCEWIKSDIFVDYNYKNDFSPEKFLKFIDDELKEGGDGCD